MNDAIVLDNIIPKQTQQRFAAYVSNTDFEWKDYNHILSAGFYFENLSFDSDAISVPSDSLIKLCYFNNFKQSKILDQTIYWLGIAILDAYSQATGTTVSSIMRMKINNQMRSTASGYDENCCNEIHVDNFDSHKTLVYYINDSDGDTFLFNKMYDRNINHYDLKTLQRVSPKQGRAVCFNGLQFHAPSNPIYQQRRYILNINFI